MQKPNSTAVKLMLLMAMTLLSVFLQTTAKACTGVLLKTQENTFVHGRTVEFGIDLDLSVAVIPRGYQFVGQTPKGDDGMQYSAKYAAIGVIAYKNVKLLDGINEKGLAIGSFYFSTFASYTPLTEANQAKALSPSDFPNWVLTQFASVAQVRQAIEAGNVVITPTVIAGWGPTPPPFHYVIYDQSGASLVVEPLNGKLVLYDNPFGTFTNSPTFDWHMTNLRHYIGLNPTDVPQVTIDGVTLQEMGLGNGMLGLPGDFTPISRFVRAAIFSTTAVPAATTDEGILQVFHILNNFDIPVGAVREQINGATHMDKTILTVARDPQGLRYFYKSYVDQTIRMAALKQFDLNSKEVKILPIDTEQPTIDMSPKFKTLSQDNS